MLETSDPADKFLKVVQQGFRRTAFAFALASISTRNSSVNGNGVWGGEITAQANWMISFLSPNQGIGVG